MMWVVLAREPFPDLVYWPGRRWLAALDATAWPAIGFALLLNLPGRTGLVLPVVGAGFALVGLARLRTAVWMNHRYRFTTWRLGKVVGVLLLFGAALKLASIWQ
jgi:hypothetical protein